MRWQNCVCQSHPFFLLPFKFINHFYLLTRDLLWYKIIDPAMCVMPHSGFEPTLFNRVPILGRLRDRLRPRRILPGGTQPAKAGSKLSGTRHGGVFSSPSKGMKTNAPSKRRAQRRYLRLRLAGVSLTQWWQAEQFTFIEGELPHQAARTGIIDQLLGRLPGGLDIQGTEIACDHDLGSIRRITRIGPPGVIITYQLCAGFDIPDFRAAIASLQHSIFIG